MSNLANASTPIARNNNITISNSNNKEKNNSHDGITSNLNTISKVSPISAQKNNIDMLVIPASAFASPSSTLITNSEFFYDSENTEEDNDLSFNCSYIGDATPYSDHDDEYCESDLCAPIDRMTPPPPLMAMEFQFQFPSHPLSQAEADADTDSDPTHSIHNLSVIIPNPIDENKETCNTNNLTPPSVSIDNDDFEQVNVESRKSSQKRFEWNVNDKADTYQLNAYLVEHIQSLYEDSLSD